MTCDEKLHASRYAVEQQEQRAADNGMADVMEDIDLRSTAEIDAKRGTADSLDEAALHAARPAVISIPASHVSKGKVAKYYLKCTTADGRSWAVAKRYSQFKALKDKLVKTSPGVAKIAFPKKTWGSGIDAATVAERTSGLTAWTNEVAKALPDDVALEREVCMFLAEDDSLADLEEEPATAEKVRGALGIVSPVPPPAISLEAAAASELPAMSKLPMSPASAMQAAMSAGELSLAEVGSPRSGQQRLPSAWQDDDIAIGAATEKTVVVQVLRSEAGRIDPTTGVWQLNEGKGSRHVRYVLRVSALGRPAVEVRRRWRQLLSFSDELQKLSKGWLKEGDRWHESNRLVSSWRNPGFDGMKLDERRKVLAAFFTAFSAWATRLRSHPTRCMDFFDPNPHARLQKIHEFLVGPVSAGDEGEPMRASLAYDDSLLVSAAAAAAGDAAAPALVDYSAFYSDSAAQIVAATEGSAVKIVGSTPPRPTAAAPPLLDELDLAQEDEPGAAADPWNFAVRGLCLDSTTPSTAVSIRHDCHVGIGSSITATGHFCVQTNVADSAVTVTTNTEGVPLAAVPDLTLRGLRRSDLHGLRVFGLHGLSKMSRSLFAPFPWDSPEELDGALSSTIENHLEQRDWHVVLVAGDGSTIVGEVFLWSVQEAIPELGIAVADEYHRTGLGHFLLHVASAVATALGAQAIELTTVPGNGRARRLYETCGWESLGMIRNPIGVDVTAAFAGEVVAKEFCDEVHMVKMLCGGGGADAEHVEEAVRTMLVEKQRRAERIFGKPNFEAGRAP